MAPALLAASLLTFAPAIPASAQQGGASGGASNAPAQMFPLSAVRLLDGPFATAAAANREYLLKIDPDRLLAPFRREAALPAKTNTYPNWESSGLDGHTGGHYLSALANMIASGQDTTNGEFKRRLDYMVSELAECQKAAGNGYVGGVPGSSNLWVSVKAGRINALGPKWVPWYNLHKTFAGLRDAYLVGGNAQAREVLVQFGEWCSQEVAGLSDDQMQRMLGTEHGGMNESMADIYAITGDKKFLDLARRFTHKAVIDPLIRHEDRLTGLHANTQIPKIVGLERIAALAGDAEADSGASFFWGTVVSNRSVAFGGNSVSEHFNNPKDFKGMLENREGPETCNTYNMLRLTEQLFAAHPKEEYADYYERALYNHILASINTQTPGYVYFTPIRPDHYRVYSTPDNCFWCCVGTGMENPGKYGQFIYARATNGIYVNLFIASELSVPDLGLTLVQQTDFPDKETSRLILKLKKPAKFTLLVRHPAWCAANDFKCNPGRSGTAPGSYVEIEKEWRDGDQVEISLPMRTTIERLPDGSDWVAFLRGPIVLASPAGSNNMTGLRAGSGRMAHSPSGPLVPLDKAPVLLASVQDLPAHLTADPASGPMRFRLNDIVEPAASKEGLALMPFFRLHDVRYQMYWQVTSREVFEERRARLAAEEAAKAERDANTLDRVAAGEQQPEVEHAFAGEESNSGNLNGKRWRQGRSFQYTLSTKNEKAVVLSVTYYGGDAGRPMEILANGVLLAKEELKAGAPGEPVELKFPIPADVLAAAKDGNIVVKFQASVGTTARIFETRLLKAAQP